MSNRDRIIMFAMCILTLEQARDAAREGDQPAVGMLDVVERAAGLRELADLAGGHVEEARGLRFLDGDVN